MSKLIATQIEKLGDGMHADGDGLYLHVRGGSRSWFYRYQINGRRRKMSLGGWPSTSLKKARQARDEAAELRLRGIDPLEAKAPKAEVRTLSEVIAMAHDALSPELRPSGDWMGPLKNHITPKLGSRDVTGLTAADLYQTLKPIWRSKPVTALKALNRVGIALRTAEAADLAVDPRIVVKAKTMLGSQGHKPKNIPAMDWRDVPAFYASLSEDSPASLALRFLILTAARSKPVRFAEASQIEDGVWTTPADLMKGQEGKTSDFRIPLSDEAQRIASLGQESGLLFPSVRGNPMSDMAMAQLLKRRKLDVRPHGFRSSFRTWAEDQGIDYDVAETCLAHSTGNSVSRAYRRSDLIQRRAVVMQSWADHVLMRETAQVIAITG